MIDALVAFWRTIVDLVALICLAVVLYQNRTRVRARIEWLVDRLRRR